MSTNKGQSIRLLVYFFNICQYIFINYRSRKSQAKIANYSAIYYFRAGFVDNTERTGLYDLNFIIMNRYYILVIIISALFTISSCIGDDEVVNNIVVGDHVPVFSAEGVDGTYFDSAEFTGKRSLLVLFATTCSDCRRELPLIEWIWNSVKDDQGIFVVAISREEEKGVVQGYWESANLSMPAYLDPDRSIFSKFATATVPRIYIINEAGVIEWMAIEELDISKEELLFRLLGE